MMRGAAILKPTKTASHARASSRAKGGRKGKGFASYQAKAKEIAGLKLEGVYSLAGARAAVLSKYGEQPGDSGSVPWCRIAPAFCDWRRVRLSL
jgi:hypothetical protein